MWWTVPKPSRGVVPLRPTRRRDGRREHLTRGVRRVVSGDSAKVGGVGTIGVDGGDRLTVVLGGGREDEGVRADFVSWLVVLLVSHGYTTRGTPFAFLLFQGRNPFKHSRVSYLLTHCFLFCSDAHSYRFVPT